MVHPDPPDVHLLRICNSWVTFLIIKVTPCLVGSKLLLAVKQKTMLRKQNVAGRYTTEQRKQTYWGNGLKLGKKASIAWWLWLTDQEKTVFIRRFWHVSPKTKVLCSALNLEKIKSKFSNLIYLGIPTWNKATQPRCCYLGKVLICSVCVRRWVFFHFIRLLNMLH